jgi:hypothetical protein
MKLPTAQYIKEHATDVRIAETRLTFPVGDAGQREITLYCYFGKEKEGIEETTGEPNFDVFRLPTGEQKHLLLQIQSSELYSQLLAAGIAQERVDTYFATLKNVGKLLFEATEEGMGLAKEAGIVNFANEVSRLVPKP